MVLLGRVIDSRVGMNVIAKEDPKHYYYYLYSSLWESNLSDTISWIRPAKDHHISICIYKHL